MSYLSELKSKLSAEQYNALIQPLMYSANEAYGGEVQDYQAQLLTPLNIKKTGLPQELEMTPARKEMRSGGWSEPDYEVEIPAQAITKGLRQIGYETDGGSVITGYRSEKPIDVNGIPIYANYDAQGKLTGYEGDPAYTSWVNGKQRIIGNWDANGVPSPVISNSSGGGFIKGISNDVAAITSELGPIWTAMKIALPELALVDVATDVGRSEVNAGTALSAYQGAYGKSPFSSPNAVGGVTGPDNIDVGGGWSPSTGATAAELEAARLALETPVSSSNPIYDITEPIVIKPELSAQEVTDMIAKEQASAMSAQEIQDMIDAEKAAAAATPAQVAAAKSAGMSILDYARAGLLVNAITGDPLGLGGNTSAGSASPTGFAQVPIPSEWKSPTYAASSAPIDLNSIFSNQNFLTGTQWQGLPQQRNVSFNDIFASGQQQTPMGNITPIATNLPSAQTEVAFNDIFANPVNNAPYMGGEVYGVPPPTNFDASKYAGISLTDMIGLINGQAATGQKPS